MSYLHCPYCEIKEQAKVKTVFETLEPIDGQCPDCGAWIDRGQYSLEINSYADIYKGAINLIEDIVQQVNSLMDYLEVDTKIDGETPSIKLSTSEIIKKLFAPYAGSTSVSNLKNALEIKEEAIELDIKAEQREYIQKEDLSKYWETNAICIEFADGTDALAQENGYTLEQCLTMTDAKFFLD